MHDARFWDRMAQRYHDADRSPILQLAIDDAIGLLSADDVVLDLGCGSGPVARELRPHVKAVHGIDISAKMIALAKPSETRGLTFEVTTLEDQSLDRRGFTAIVAFNVLHYLDLDHAFKRFHDLLPSKGRIIIQAACLREVNPLIRAGLWIVARIARVPPMNRFDAHELETRLADAGFVVEASKEARTWTKVHWIVGRRI